MTSNTKSKKLKHQNLLPIFFFVVQVYQKKKTLKYYFQNFFSIFFFFIFFSFIFAQFSALVSSHIFQILRRRTPITYLTIDII